MLLDKFAKATAITNRRAPILSGSVRAKRNVLRRYELFIALTHSYVLSVLSVKHFKR